MMTMIPRNSPVIDLLIIAVGILLLIFRNKIGSMTNYFVRGKYIDEPTAGCLLIPFALAFIIGGTILLIKYMMGG